MDKRWSEFDGLRILALLIIIASHTNALGMFGQGSVAVSLFFVMSGFFSVKPMLENGEEVFVNIKGWLKFYLLKIVRIVPLYWICILFVKYVSDNTFSDNKFLLQNMFFINSYSHLWYIQHLMVAYLVTPLILYIIFLCKKYCKINNFMCSAAIFIIGVIGGKYLMMSFNCCKKWWKYDFNFCC